LSSDPAGALVGEKPESATGAKSPSCPHFKMVSKMFETLSDFSDVVMDEQTFNLHKRINLLPLCCTYELIQ
jgi:hypothetical protein